MHIYIYVYIYIFFLSCKKTKMVAIYDGDDSPVSNFGVTKKKKVFATLPGLM